MDAVGQRLGAGGLHGLKPVGQHGTEDLDHLAIAVRHTAELALHAPHRRWQVPLLEGGAVTQGAGLAGEHGDVMQRIVDSLVAAESARVLPDDLAVLPELHALGIGADLDRPADGAGLDRVAVVVEPHEAGLRQ